MDERIPFNRARVESMWEDLFGSRWCFVFIDGVPWLSCEDDS